MSSSRKTGAVAPKPNDSDVKLSKSQKKKQKQKEIEAIIDRKLDEIRARDIEKKDNVDDLFVVDTKGNLESRTSRKRRAKLEASRAEPAPPVKKAKRPSATATAAARAPSVSGRKKAKTSATASIDVPKAPSLAVDGDLWAPAPEIKVIDPETNFEVTDVLVKQRKRRNPSEAKKGMVTTAIEELPHAGQSYNPLPEAHQEAIMKAYEVESKRLKDEEELALKLRYKHPSQLPKAIEAPTEPEEEESTAVVKKKPKALTKAERNRRKRIEDQEKNREKEKQQKDILKQIGQLPRLVKELKKDSQAPKVEDSPSQKKHKLGKLEFEAAFPEVALSDELTGNLRAAPVRTTDVVMREQFKKFQAKGFIEPRVRVTKYHRTPKMAPKVLSRTKYIDSVPL